MEILGVRWGGLGDLLVILPSIQLIRRLHPQAKFILAAGQEGGNLLKAAGLIDNFIPSEDRRLASLFQLPSEASDEWLRRFDRVFVWLNRPKAEWVALMERSLGKKLSVLAANDCLGLTLSRIFFMMTAKAIPSDTEKEHLYEKMAFLPIRPEWGKEAEELFPSAKASPLVIIHPGSGGRQKRWELGNFLEIVNRLSAEGVSGAIITGPAENDYLPFLSSFPWPPSWGWLNEPLLSTVAWLLAKSALYLGNDSGVTQLAGLCGCRGVALFLEENARLWAPPGRIQVIKAGSLSEIKVEGVWEEIKATLSSFRDTP